MSKRLDYIDKAKGILIILVVIGHIWQSGPVFNVIYSFHMPAFFVISGILMSVTRSYEKRFGDFLVSRLFSLGIPFIWIEFLGCITDIVRHGVTLNVKGYLHNTMYLQFNDPNLWFLLTLFLIELLFFWMAKLIKKRSVLLAASVMLFVASLFISKNNNFINALGKVFYYNLFFACGFCWPGVFKKTCIPLIIGSIAAIFAAGLFLDRDSGRMFSPNALAFLISGLCGTYAVIQAGKISFPHIIERTLTHAGMNTIIIFGTHHFYYAVIGKLMGVTDYSTTPIVTGLIILLGVAILEVPTICIINRWVPWMAGKRRKVRMQ